MPHPLSLLPTRKPRTRTEGRSRAMRCRTAALAAALLLLRPRSADAQSLFGPVIPHDGPVDECPLSAYERRAGEVQDICCTDGCPNGLPQDCNLDCAVIFMDYYDDCQTLMTTLMGEAVVTQFEAFNAKCLRRNDVPTLLNMVRSMSLQGCTADEGLNEAAAEDDAAVGFGAADGVDSHFSVELGNCNYENIETKTAAVDRACCSGAQGDVCESGVPTVCDIECAIHYVPFHEDCNALLQGSFDGGMAAYEQLYGQCMTNSRRGASQLLRTMYLTNEAWDTEECPIEASLDYFGDCPGSESECIAEFIDVQPDLAANNVFPYYRIQVEDNWGAAYWCMKEMCTHAPCRAAAQYPSRLFRARAFMMLCMEALTCMCVCVRVVQRCVVPTTASTTLVRWPPKCSARTPTRTTATGLATAGATTPKTATRAHRATRIRMDQTTCSMIRSRIRLLVATSAQIAVTLSGSRRST